METCSLHITLCNKSSCADVQIGIAIRIPALRDVLIQITILHVSCAWATQSSLREPSNSHAPKDSTSHTAPNSRHAYQAKKKVLCRISPTAIRSSCLDTPARIFLVSNIVNGEMSAMEAPNFLLFNVDKKNQLDVTFCILYFSSNSCSTCFGQPCAHLQELTTA